MRQARWMRAALAAVALVAGLSGCGFHLRGAASLPEAIQVVAVRAPSLAVREEIAVFLEDGGVRVVDAGADVNADAVLSVFQEAYERRVLSVDPNTGKAREFELAYIFDFSFIDREGKALVKPQSVRLVRDFVFDEDAVIGKSREEGVLREEMRRDAVQQLIRRLQAGLGA